MTLTIGDYLLVPGRPKALIQVGVHGKAVGYATVYNANINPQEIYTSVNPTDSLRGKVTITIGRRLHELID